VRDSIRLEQFVVMCKCSKVLTVLFSGTWNFPH